MRYRGLALAIGQNAKGSERVKALPKALHEIERRGGCRKAVIFTESVRVQRHLSDLLAASGYEGGIDLLHGRNNDPQSNAIYADWLSRHRGTDP